MRPERDESLKAFFGPVRVASLFRNRDPASFPNFVEVFGHGERQPRASPQFKNTDSVQYVPAL